MATKAKTAKKQKDSTTKKQIRTERSLAATIGAIAALVLFIVTLIVIGLINRREIACTSSRGNITLSYDKKKIVGYTATGVEFDFKAQQKYSQETGIENYINEFEEWFKSNTDDGVCERK